jgi:16S rRNA processing protein RimM
MDEARGGVAPAVQLLKLGRVTGVHGLSGAVRLKLDNPATSALATIDRLYVAADGAAMRVYQIREVRPLNHGAVRLALEGVNDPSAAETLKGATALVDAASLPPTEPDEFYYYEAIGCMVHTTDGRALGTIEEIFATGANDVWVVRDGTTEVLVPVIADVVKSMDFAARSIVIEAVPGLLD